MKSQYGKSNVEINERIKRYGINVKCARFDYAHKNEILKGLAYKKG